MLSSLNLRSNDDWMAIEHKAYKSMKQIRAETHWNSPKPWEQDRERVSKTASDSFLMKPPFHGSSVMNTPFDHSRSTSTAEDPQTGDAKKKLPKCVIFLCWELDEKIRFCAPATTSRSSDRQAEENITRQNFFRFFGGKIKVWEFLPHVISAVLLFSSRIMFCFFSCLVWCF